MCRMPGAPADAQTPQGHQTLPCGRRRSPEMEKAPGTQNSQGNLKRKSQEISWFWNHYKVTGIKTAWCRHKAEHLNQKNRAENPGKKRTCLQPTEFWQMWQNNSMTNEMFSTKCQDNWIATHKRKKSYIYLAPRVKINWELIKDLNCKRWMSGKKTQE